MAEKNSRGRPGVKRGEPTRKGFQVSDAQLAKAAEVGHTTATYGSRSRRPRPVTVKVPKPGKVEEKAVNEGIKWMAELVAGGDPSLITYEPNDEGAWTRATIIVPTQALLERRLAAK